jgi:hypothetical protein
MEPCLPKAGPGQSLDQPATTGDDCSTTVNPSKERGVRSAGAQLLLVLGCVYHQGKSFVKINSAVV